MTLVTPPPNVLGPKYECRQGPRNSQGFRIERSQGNLARTTDVAVVISLNNFLGPVDDTVTTQKCSTSHKHKHTATMQPKLGSEMFARREKGRHLISQDKLSLYLSPADVNS